MSFNITDLSPEQLAALSPEQIAAFAAASDTDGVQIEAPADTKRKPGRPKGSKNKTTASDDSQGVWTVHESWKGTEPRARMVAACFTAGMSAAAVDKVRKDKYTCSLALGNASVKAGRHSRVEIVA